MLSWYARNLVIFLQMKAISKMTLLLVWVISFALFGCTSQPPEKNIVIIYDNDVHCAVDGYVKLSGIRDAVADTAYVFTVSSGDFLQGGAFCSISKGTFSVDLMNAVGYDVVTLGDHEFDFSVDRLMKLSRDVKADIVNVNFSKVGSTTPVFKPYVIRNAGSRKIAFVGVLTPETLVSESYAFYDDDGKLLYHFHENEIYNLVQNAVNEARKEGADYVVVLSHLGELPPLNSKVTSISLIENTDGIDAVLDGHMHSVVEEMWVVNAKGDSVLLSQTGTQFSHIGKLDIGRNGRFHSTLISVDSSVLENRKVKAVVDSLSQLKANLFERKLSLAPFELTINKGGERFVRKGETNLGDLVADAYRTATGAQIGLANGGGIRRGIAQGAVTYHSILDASPFFNDICKIEATGRQIVEALEQGSKNYPEEFGGFLQVSGLRYEINSSTKMKVGDVQIEDESGNFAPIELERLYTVGTSSYVAKKGTEITAFKTSKILIGNVATDTDVLADYVKKFGDSIPDLYRKSQGRIRIR